MDNPSLNPRRPRWLRVLLSLAFIALALITLGALALTFEGWRGTRKWKAYKKELETRGEVLDLMALRPKPVPDERNFAKHPLIARMFERQPSSGEGWSNEPMLPAATAEDRQNDKPARGPVRKKDDTRPLLQMWSEYYVGHTNFPQAPPGSPPALVVHTALSKHDADIQSLKEAMSARPECYYPLRYEEGLGMVLQHLGSMKPIALTLQLRAIANLHLGQAEEAFSDLRLGFFLADTMQRDPLLINFLVRAAMDGLLLEAVKEGLCLRRWNDAQLAWFTDYLGRRSYLADNLAALRLERAFCLHTTDLVRQGRMVEAVSDSESAVARAAVKALPSGIFHHNMYYIALVHQQYVLPAIIPGERRVDRKKVEAFDRAINDPGPMPYVIFARLLLPAISHTTIAAARWQSLGDATMLACAAERHRLATGQLPARLEDLSPKYLSFIPRDVVSGQPLVFRVENADHYLIYSRGWNEKDEGGLLSLRKEDGDWGVEIKPASE